MGVLQSGMLVTRAKVLYKFPRVHVGVSTAFYEDFAYVLGLWSFVILLPGLVVGLWEVWFGLLFKGSGL